MNFIFQSQLKQELLRSEKRRTIILICIFSFAVLYRIVDALFLKADDEMQIIRSVATIWLFPLIILSFEVISLLFLNARIRSRKNGIPILAQYLNTAFEICIPSLIILYVGRQHPAYNVLKSPVLFIYFIFIILSTLRLNFKLSVFCGLLASMSYIIFSHFIYHHFNSTDGARAILILLCGVAAGLVANQIRAGIDNSLRETEKQQKIAQLFGKQVSKEVAEKMMESDGTIESKRMNVAVMFIDIRNFTKFVSNKSPEEIVQYQNAFFSIVVDVVERHNGIVNQFLGDGCMVTFGAPVDLQNPSRNAVSAALDLLKELEINIHSKKLPITNIGIGIHSGEAVTGNIGTAARQQYSITGNVVILAARIEQLNKEFQSQLLVSEDVHLAVNSEGRLAESLGNVELKGWHKPMSIYKLA